MRGIRVGIDATNLRRGGGRTHLIELLRAAQPQDHRIDRVIVWAGQATLDLLEDRDWLVKRNPSALNAGLLRRSLWQRYRLSKEAQVEKCDVLFVPGGSYAGNFHPIVTMSRNMLPFEWRELQRYGWTLTTVKLLLLRRIQSRSFQHADGVIFLTGYARDAVQKVTGILNGSIRVIPHGLNARFLQHADNICTKEKDTVVRILYVSHVEPYKHQWKVVEAISKLRSNGYRLRLDLVGAPGNAKEILQHAIRKYDSRRGWVFYHGHVSFDVLDRIYSDCDIGVFASSCENMPNTLLEMMGAGIPIACSQRGPMPEILQDGGVYFDPEKSSSIATAVQQLLDYPDLAEHCRSNVSAAAKNYTWEESANRTFTFLANVASDFVK